MNELTTINTTTLTNKKLVKELNTIQKCMLTVGKSEWGFAKSVSIIMSEELYKDDFETDKKLADALGIAKSDNPLLDVDILITGLWGCIESVILKKCQSEYWDKGKDYTNRFISMWMKSIFVEEK